MRPTFSQLWTNVAGEQRARPFVTWALVTLNFAAWFAVAWAYHLSPLATQNSELLLRAGALDGELLRAGQLWRLITSQFLHVHFIHLVFNMAALLLLGGALERSLGSLRFVLLYVTDGVIGMAASVAAAPALVSSGASQAVMGLAGATIVEGLRRRGLRPLRLAALIVIVAQVALDLASVGYVKAGHLGGICAGALLGWALSKH